jgi:hypothetical protein|tara:strand:+ start:163 stop:456 length:294 start_codon:yes stop_codon:yes gene_type:complete
MEESVVSIVATRYLEMWNEQYAIVNETKIVSYGVSAAMQDIEGWIDGVDPNDSREMAGCADFTVEQLREVYSLLAPSASFFGYTPAQRYTRVTETET